MVDKCKTCIFNHEPPCKDGAHCNIKCVNYGSYEHGFGNYSWGRVCESCEKASNCEYVDVVAAFTEENPCKYCGLDSNDFVPLNPDTSDYSGVTIAMNRQGMLRARAMDCHDIVLIKYCPFCGRELKVW